MKKLFRSYGFGAILFLLMANLLPALLMAQDSGGSTQSTTTTSTTSKVTETAWYMSPWAWVAGAAVFILLLVALVRGSSGNTDRVTVTKTTTSE